jgi:hypothetical protein
MCRPESLGALRCPAASRQAAAAVETFRAGVADYAAGLRGQAGPALGFHLFGRFADALGGPGLGEPALAARVRQAWSAARAGRCDRVGDEFGRLLDLLGRVVADTAAAAPTTGRLSGADRTQYLVDVLWQGFYADVAVQREIAVPPAARRPR